MGPGFLAEALKPLKQISHPDLLVGFDLADDAGVFRINDTQALVQTVDFFPPVVDDPFEFGKIAAANALSDIYAMGGRPLTALNIVAFPVNTMPPSILTEILRGGAEKVGESGAVIVGGHSIKDKELKYGLSVTGIVDPSKVITNAGAKVGDIVFLTKPLGTGLITTAIKRDRASSEIISLVIDQMAALNRKAAELMIRHNVSAATDITGFGLIGHACEMAIASKVTLSINCSQIPLLPDLLELVEEGMSPGGTNDNRTHNEGNVNIEKLSDPRLGDVLYDPQTSGGLLIAIPEEKAENFSASLKKLNIPDKPIGKVEKRSEYPLIII